MELMIVIVIIGILSAVGMVMFGGQTEKAKIAATKANHKQAVKYVISEIMECDLGEDKIFEGNLNCSQLNPGAAATAAVIVLKEKFTNAHQPNHAIKEYSSGISYGCRANTNFNLGIICFYGEQFNNKILLFVEVCFQESCNDSKNILLSKITVE